jgi:hypothetical protein
MNLKITPKTLGLSIENRNLRDKTLFILKINCICTFSPQLFFSKKLGRQKKKILEKDVISRIKRKKNKHFLWKEGRSSGLIRARKCSVHVNKVISFPSVVHRFPSLTTTVLCCFLRQLLLNTTPTHFGSIPNIFSIWERKKNFSSSWQFVYWIESTHTTTSFQIENNNSLE